MVIELCAHIYNDVWEAAGYAVATLLQSHPMVNSHCFFVALAVVSYTVACHD